jgi:hypothetical protein
LNGVLYSGEKDGMIRGYLSNKTNSSVITKERDLECIVELLGTI